MAADLSRVQRVLSFGEVMVELSLTPGADTARLAVAGDTFNTAVYLRRAAPPALHVGYATVLGTDALSDRILATLTEEGIETSEVARTPTRRPGLYAITTDAQGERSFAYWRDQSAARRLFSPHGGAPDFSLLDRCDLAYASAITLAILPPAVRDGFLAALAPFRARGGVFVFDSNYRPALWADADTARAAVAAAWALADIGLPSLDDELALFGDADAAAVIDRLRGWGVMRGALKRGAAGPLALSGAPAPGPWPAAPRVVDTTAAGDSFNGAYLAALLAGADEAAAMRAGHHCAIRVIGHRGAIIPKDAP